RHGRRRIVTGGLSGRRPTKKSAPRTTSKCSTTAFRSRTSRISKSPPRTARPAGQAKRRRESMEEQDVLAHLERTCPRRQHPRRSHRGGADPVGDGAGQGGAAGFLV